MGGGLHNGSAPGKGICSFPHSLVCPGGIEEDDSWSACPKGYVAGVISTTGFENTLQQSDFGPAHSSTVYEVRKPPSPSDQVNSTPYQNGGPWLHPQTIPRQAGNQHGSTPLSAPKQGFEQGQQSEHVTVLTPNPNSRRSATRIELDPRNLPHHVQINDAQQGATALNPGQADGGG